jgi:hypothetical protein
MIRSRVPQDQSLFSACGWYGLVVVPFLVCRRSCPPRPELSSETDQGITLQTVRSPGCCRGRATREGAAMNFIIVSDAFRYDYLGANGNAWIKTPELDAFSQIAVNFVRCTIASPLWCTPGGRSDPVY